MLLKSGILALAIIGICYGQLDDPERTLQDLTQQFGDPNVANKLNQTELNATISQVNEVFKKKCLQNADEKAYENAYKAKDKLMECIQSLVNTEELQKEIDEASPKGELDEVFKKYCQKSPKAKECFHDFTKTLEPCFSEKERKNLKIVNNITESLANFICFKEGDRIALFIAESGPECLKEHQEDVQNCFNSTYGGRVNTKDISLDNIPELVFDEKSCNDMVVLENCVVTALEQCKQPTPANIAQSLFKFVRQVTPCNNLKANAQPSNSPNPNSAAQMAQSVFTIAAAAIVLRHL